jgi:hypothetical protein
MMCCASRAPTMDEKARRRNAVRAGSSKALVEERRKLPRELRPLPLEPEPEPEPEPPQLEPVEPEPVLRQNASPVPMPKPYSGSLTAGSGFTRYVRLLPHVVLIVLLGGLAVQRGTVFSGQFPYSQQQAESPEEDEVPMMSIWARVDLQPPPKWVRWGVFTECAQELGLGELRQFRLDECVVGLAVALFVLVGVIEHGCAHSAEALL